MNYKLETREDRDTIGSLNLQTKKIFLQILRNPFVTMIKKEREQKSAKLVTKTTEKRKSKKENPENLPLQ